MGEKCDETKPDATLPTVNKLMGSKLIRIIGNPHAFSLTAGIVWRFGYSEENICSAVNHRLF